MITKCVVCNRKMSVKPSRIKRVKHGITCSKKCFGARQKDMMKGSKNHQFGLKGNLNSSFKSDEKISNYGYKLIRKVSHPYCDCDGFVREHRLVVEANFKMYDIKYFINIDSNYYLKTNIVVHHRNENKLDNNPLNLVPLTRAEHSKLHNLDNTIIRDNKGKIIGVIKSGELLENLEEDNQQPSYMNLHNSNIEGSETNGRGAILISPTRAPDTDIVMI